MAADNRTPAERTLLSKAMNDRRWSVIPRAERAKATEAARAAIWQRYLDRVDPDGVLPDDERQQLANQARRADLRLRALASVRARREARQ